MSPHIQIVPLDSLEDLILADFGNMSVNEVVETLTPKYPQYHLGCEDEVTPVSKLDPIRPKGLCFLVAATSDSKKVRVFERLGQVQRVPRNSHLPCARALFIRNNINHLLVA